MPTQSRAARAASPAALATTTTLVALTAALLAAAPAGAATGDPAASSVIAVDSTTAQESRPAAARVIGVDADIPAGLTITGTQGKPVTLTTKGQKARTAIGRDGAPLVFTKLTPGKAYTVFVGGTRVGKATPVATPSQSWGLTVSTIDTPGAVSLIWRHTPTRTQGRVSYAVTATPRGADGRALPQAPVVTGTASSPAAELDGLDPDLLYTLSVQAVNTAGRGKASTAVMNRTLGQIWGKAERVTDPATPPTPAPVTAAAPAPAPAPASPSTRTVYVCPGGFIDSGNSCTDTKAYSFHTETVTLAYTFHTVTTGSAPLLDSYETVPRACPSGYNLEDYGWVAYCRRYGTAPTARAKDAIPTGYIDNGTAWVKDVQVKDAAPSGYADTGTAWVKTVGKVAMTVPA